MKNILLSICFALGLLGCAATLDSAAKHNDTLKQELILEAQAYLNISVGATEKAGEIGISVVLVNATVVVGHQTRPLGVVETMFYSDGKQLAPVYFIFTYNSGWNVMSAIKIERSK